MAIVEGSNAIFEIEIEAEPKATLNWTLSEKNLIDMPVSYFNFCFRIIYNPK